MDRLERINNMENIFDELDENIKTLHKALEGYEALQEKLAKLENYYGSDTYMLDLEADERGEYPENLKRGILSEDGIWNLLVDKDSCLYLMKKLSKDVI